MGGCHVAAEGEQDKGAANTMSERKNRVADLEGIYLDVHYFLDAEISFWRREIL